MSTSSRAEQSVIVAGSDHDFPPYEFTQNGKPTGFTVELMQAVADVMGFTVKFEPGPWNKILRGLQEQKIDVLTGMSFSEDRTKFYTFTVPHTMIFPGLFVRKGSSIRSLDDLKNKEIVVQDADIMHEYLKKNHPDVKIITVADPPEGLRLVSSGKHDGILLASEVHGHYTINYFGLMNLVPVKTNLPPIRYCFSMLVENEALRHKLDQGFNILKATGKYQEIYNKWYGIYEQQHWWATIRYFVLSLLLIGILFFGSVVWSRLLQQQVRIRTAELHASEDELRKAHAELEQRVEERTAELTQAYEQLRTSEEKYRSLVDNINICVYQSTVDHPGQFLRVNPAMVEMSGYDSAEDLMNLPVANLYQNPQDRQRILDALKQNGFVKDIEIPMIKKDGAVVWASLTMNVKYDEERKIKWIDGVGEDITERRRAQKMLARKTAELERSNKELEHFASIASHDLKAPLTAIAGFAQVLEIRSKDSLDEQSQRALTHIIKGTYRMEALINDLLAYARVTSDGRCFKLVDMKIIFDIMLTNLELAIAENHAAISCGDLPVIYGDEIQFVQLFQNLVGNALKYRNEKPPVVQITAERLNGSAFAVDPLHSSQDQGWLFSVKDNGIGIDQDHFDSIFQIFKRVHREEKYTGTGIGLAICQKIVERHGGRIWVESKPGKGSIFYFTIPDHHS